MESRTLREPLCGLGPSIGACLHWIRHACGSSARPIRPASDTLEVRLFVAPECVIIGEPSFALGQRSRYESELVMTHVMNCSASRSLAETTFCAARRDYFLHRNLAVAQGRATPLPICAFRAAKGSCHTLPREETASPARWNARDTWRAIYRCAFEPARSLRQDFCSF